MFCETLHNIVHLIAGAAAAPGLAPQRFAWIACAVLHHRTPQRTSFKLIAFIACRRARARRRPGACALAGAQVDTGCCSVVWRGDVSVMVPRRRRRPGAQALARAGAQVDTGCGRVVWRGDVSVTVPRRRRRRWRRLVHGQRRLHCWDPQVSHHHCRRKAPPGPTSWPNFLECLRSNSQNSRIEKTNISANGMTDTAGQYPQRSSSLQVFSHCVLPRRYWTFCP